jgi:hypothetical protein
MITCSENEKMIRGIINQCKYDTDWQHQAGSPSTYALLHHHDSKIHHTRWHDEGQCTAQHLLRYIAGLPDAAE